MPRTAAVAPWMLDCIVHLDELRPGLAGHYLRASNERRHVIAAYCSTRETIEALDTNDADFLVAAGHRAILCRAFDTVPNGLRGALARMPSGGEEQHIYALLHGMLAAPAHEMIPITIKRLKRIDVVNLQIIEKLPESLCHSEIVEALDRQRDAIDLARLVPAMIDAGADEREFIRALRTAPRQDFKPIFQRWSLKLRFPPGPLVAEAGYTPIQSGSQLEEFSRKYRNCLKSYVAELLAGETAFGELLCPEGDAIIQFRRTDGLWTHDGTYIFRNRAVATDLLQAVENFCRPRGLRSRAERTSRGSDPWRLLRSVTGHWDWPN